MNKIIIDTKFLQLYHGGISAYTEDLLDELSGGQVEEINFERVEQKYPIFRVFPRKFKIILYDMYYFRKLCKDIGYVDVIILPYHDCRVTENLASCICVFVHDDEVLLNWGKTIQEKLIVWYYRSRLNSLLKVKNLRFYTVSQFSKNKLEKLLNRDFKVRYNSVSEQFFIPAEDVSSAAIDTVAPFELKICYTGGFHFRKNFDFIFEVLKSIKKKNKRLIVRLFITGTPRGSYLEVIQRMRDYCTVYVLGRLDWTELVRLYRQCTINLYPTHNEGFGRVVVEACLTNCYVLTQNIPVFSEIACGSQYHVPIEALDSEVWAEHILKLNDTGSSFSFSDERKRFDKFKPKIGEGDKIA